MYHPQKLCLPLSELEIHRGRCCVENLPSEQPAFSTTHVYDWIISLLETAVVSEKPAVLSTVMQNHLPLHQFQDLSLVASALWALL